MPRPELERLQLERLEERFGVRSLEELAEQPFATKAMLRDAYPFGLLRVPLTDCVRVHGSSGTRGKPTIVAYTRGDVERWADCCARALAAAGAEPGTIVHVAYGYGLFTGGLGLHYGAERLGCTTVPASGGNTPRQVQLLEDLGARDPLLHAELRPRDRRPRGGRSRLSPARRRLRRRALDGGAARLDRGGARPPRARHLRALGGHGTGRLVAVPRRRRPACQRGPLPRRGRRPLDRRARARRRDGRARLHDADEGGAPVPALPHRRPRLARRASRARAGGRSHACRACSAAPTTCS